MFKFWLSVGLGLLKGFGFELSLGVRSGKGLLLVVASNWGLKRGWFGFRLGWGIRLGFGLVLVFVVELGLGQMR